MDSRQTIVSKYVAGNYSVTAEFIPQPASSYELSKITIDAPSKDGKKTKTRFFRFESQEDKLLGKGYFATVFPLTQEREDGTALTKDRSPGYVIKKFPSPDATSTEAVKNSACDRLCYEAFITSKATHHKKKKTGETSIDKRKAWVIAFRIKKNGLMLLAMIQSREKGIDLLRVLADPKSYPLSVKQKAQLTLNIIDAVIRLHRDGIIHRDLKPANIIVDLETLAIEIIDFGLSKPINGSPHPGGNIVGTPLYSPPEQRLTHMQQYTGETSDDYSAVDAIICPLWDMLSEAEREDRKLPNPAEDKWARVERILKYTYKDIKFVLPENASELQKEIKSLSEEVCKFKPPERLRLQAYRDKLCQLDSFKAALAGRGEVAAIEKVAALQIEPTKEKEAQPSKNVLDCESSSTSGLQTLSLFKQDVQNVSKQSGQTCPVPLFENTWNLRRAT